jgi:hypothetical protein
MKVPASNYRVVTGSEEVRALISSLFANPSPRPNRAYGISDMEMLERHFEGFIPSSTNFARLDANISSRFIYTSVKGPVYSRSDDVYMRHSKYLPPEQLTGCADLTIVGNTVVFMTESGPEVIAHAVTSPEIAGQMVSLFNFLWAYAE